MHPIRFITNFAVRFLIMNSQQAAETLGPDTWPQHPQRLSLEDIHLLLDSLSNSPHYHSPLVEFCTDRILEMVQNNIEDDKRDFQKFDQSNDTVLQILDVCCRLLVKF